MLNLGAKQLDGGVTPNFFCRLKLTFSLLGWFGVSAYGDCKEISDAPHECDDALSPCRWFKTKEAFLFSARGLMGILYPIIEYLMRAMLDSFTHVTNWLGVAPELVRYNHPRLCIGIQQTRPEADGSLFIAQLLQKHIQLRALIIHATYMDSSIFASTKLHEKWSICIRISGYSWVFIYSSLDDIRTLSPYRHNEQWCSVCRQVFTKSILPFSHQLLLQNCGKPFFNYFFIYKILST